MKNQTPPKKRKKRRLRKEIRYALSAFGLIVAFGIFGLLVRALWPSGAAAEANMKSALDPVIVEDLGETVATLLIDPGHGGYDSGKTPDNGSDIYEKEINLEIAQKVAAELERINPNIKVILTRTSDEVPWPADEVEDLTYREEMQSKVGADYFLSLHCNADDYPSTSGYIFFIKPNDSTSLALSRAMAANFEKIGWSSLHSINTNELLQVVTNAKIPSILLEMGFITNQDDFELLIDDQKTDLLATAIAQTYSDYIMAQYHAQDE